MNMLVSTAAARPRPWRVILAALGLVAGGAVLGAVATRPAAPPPAPTEADESSAADGTSGALTFSREKQLAAGVETVTVAAKPLLAFAWRSGRVALNDERLAHISPPAEGIIREVPVRLGQEVAAGDVLAVIDCRELGFLKLELVKELAALATERENASRVQTTSRNTEELLALLATETPLAAIERKMADKPIGEWRSQLLGAFAKRNQLRAQLAAQRSSAGALPEATILKTASDSDAAGAAYTALLEELRFQAKNQLRLAELKRKEAETAVSVTRAKLLTFGLTADEVEKADPLREAAAASLLYVKAPFAGTVVEKHAVRSERVGPDFQMFVLADLAELWVEADVFESDLPFVRGLTNRTITFRATAAGVAERPAKVVYTGDVIDPSSRALTLTAEAANADRALKPGMFVEVGFERGDRSPVLQVPTGAVLYDGKKTLVFVQSSDEHFEFREVTLGRAEGDAVEVVAGLRAGETVVVRGGFVLKSELFKGQMAGE